MIRKLRDPETQRFLTQESIRKIKDYLRKVDAGEIETRPSSPKDRTPEEKRKALDEEMQNSSPRAALVLIEAVFSAYLGESIHNQLALCHEDDEIQQGALKFDVLQKAIPQSLYGKINLAYALDIVPGAALVDLHRARKVRNRYVHNAEGLTPEDESEIKLASQFFNGMLWYFEMVHGYRLGKTFPIALPKYDGDI